MPRMKELVEAGLFGRGLVLIDSIVLVKRYNAALIHMGLVLTKLQSFHIDQVGWSPEIAFEQENDYYLAHGDANPLAIILTPEQANAPIYFPVHSYDWKLMERWYKSHKTQIAELTKDTAICLDIDQEVDLYAVPTDLLMVSDVMVRASTPNRLMTSAAAQQSLVKRWLSEPDAHLDGKLIADLETSAKTDGDLRRRQLVIQDYQFSDVTDFYSRKFGGSFVLRSLNQKPLLFVRDRSFADGEDVFCADESAIAYLIKYGYVETNIDWWQDHLYRLKVVAESFLVDVLDKKEARLDYAKISKVKRKGLVRKYSKQLDDYLELSRVRSALKKGEIIKTSKEVEIHLLHPSEKLDPLSREVIWQLLTYIRGGRFIPLMYRHQKTAFQSAYTKKWKNPKRSWALARVQEYYDVASKSGQLLL